MSSYDNEALTFSPKHLQGPKKWFAKCDKYYLSRSGQTSLDIGVTNIAKPVTKNNFGLRRQSDKINLLKKLVNKSTFLQIHPRICPKVD